MATESAGAICADETAAIDLSGALAATESGGTNASIGDPPAVVAPSRAAALGIDEEPPDAGFPATGGMRGVDVADIVTGSGGAPWTKAGPAPFAAIIETRDRLGWPVVLRLGGALSFEAVFAEAEPVAGGPATIAAKAASTAGSAGIELGEALPRLSVGPV